MATPFDIDARKYYRVAYQRLLEGELILSRVGLPAASFYLTGYSIEFILKALILTLTREKDRKGLLVPLRTEFGHNLRRLRVAALDRGAAPPPAVAKNLLFVSTWSPDLRYEPGLGDFVAAERFLRSARSVISWADGRM